MGLKDLDEQYEKQAVADKKEFTPLPDGQYQTKIQLFVTADTKTPPVRPMLKIEFEVISGKFAKRKIWKNIMLTAENLQYLKADLHALGWKFKLSDIDDISKRGTMLDRIVNVGLKTNPNRLDKNGKPQQNCYINSSQDRVGTASPAADAVKRATTAPTPAGGDDEPPF